MAETYSVATTGIDAGSVFAVSNNILPDSAARAGSESLAMQQGKQILFKNPDGSLQWGTIDASRSLPGGPIYILPVGP